MNYSRFTDKAKGAVQKAHQLSIDCCCGAIESPIMMVAMLKEDKDTFFYLFRIMEVEPNVFCQQLSDLVNQLPRVENPTPNISDELSVIFESALSFAVEINCDFVGLEHIFWAMSKEQNQVRDCFWSFGLKPEKIKRTIFQYRQGNIVFSPSQNNNQDSSESTFLNRYTKNLTYLAEQRQIEPSIGRDEEIRKILQITSRKTKNNPILVGAPGTGKTAIVEGLACRIINGDVPQEFFGYSIISLDIPSLFAGAGVRGEFEERIKGVVEELKERTSTILFIDEIHLLIGNSSGSLDAANILKPELARGSIKVIGATTDLEYVKYIESDKAFERRFRKIKVEEPSVESAIAILRGIKSRFEKHHKIKILDEAIVAAVKLSQRYIPDRFLPDKAIDLIDEAASKMRIERSTIPQELDEIQRCLRCKELERESILHDEQKNDDLLALNQEIANLQERENSMMASWRYQCSILETIQEKQNELEKLDLDRKSVERNRDYEQLFRISQAIEQIKQDIRLLEEEIGTDNNSLIKKALNAEDIKTVVTAWTGIPVNSISDDETEKLKNLQEILSLSVIGQDYAITKVCNIVRRNRLGLNDSSKPIGSFLFLGSTGVGKTELAKVLAEYLFDSREMVVRIDMSEYQQEYSVSRLFGAPPGYIGYDQGGQLTEAVRQKPYSVVLLDEIEKAHPKVFETLLQVLDDGRMTDGQGRVVNFKNTIVIMTSNLGANIIMGKEITSSNRELLKEQIMEEIRERVIPEFINRIDEIVLFNSLTADAIGKIVQRQLDCQMKIMKSNGLVVRFDTSVVNFIKEKSYNLEYGARPVKRAIDNYIIDALSLCIIMGNIQKDKKIYITARDGSITIQNID